MMRTDEVIEIIQVEPVWVPASSPVPPPDKGAPTPVPPEEAPVAEPAGDTRI
jgi:hypothetical protein